jgi:DNA-binding NarL/FixJ family response regulator
MVYLLKDGEPDAGLSAVRRAAQGESLLAPSVMARVVRRAVQSHHEDVASEMADPAILSALTPRERDVLALVGVGVGVGVGQSNAEIAETLHLGVTTVKTHVASVTDKLRLRNRVQAAVVAHRLGLVDDDFLLAGGVE